MAGVEPDGTFADVLAANDEYAASFPLGGVRPGTARELAVLTCIDSRIDPLPMLGLSPGDAKVLRNAGARVTDDVVRTLVLAVHLLGVRRLMVVAHTDCRATAPGDDAVRAAISEAGGPDTRDIAFLTAPDVEAALRDDVERLRRSPHLAALAVGGFVYDVATGHLNPVC